MKNDIIYYSVGALLYCPANKKTIADSVIHEKFGTKYSLALCLDAVNFERANPGIKRNITDIMLMFDG